jgi:hypothetical protein
MTLKVMSACYTAAKAESSIFLVRALTRRHSFLQIAKALQLSPMLNDDSLAHTRRIMCISRQVASNSSHAEKIDEI